MLAEKLPKWMTPETAVVCTIIGAFWWGHILASDGDKALEKKIDVKIHAQSALISKQNEEIEKLREKVIFLEGRLAGAVPAPDAETFRKPESGDYENAKENASSSSQKKEESGGTSGNRDSSGSEQKAGAGDRGWNGTADLAPETVKDPLDHVFGNENARFVIYEYLDFECPYCRQFFSDAKRYVRDSRGGIKLILRQFPLQMHGKAAQMKAYLTECAGIIGGNKAFWSAASDAFGADFSADYLADRLGVPLSKVNDCLSSEKSLEGIMTGMAEGNKLGITGTPGVVILDTKTMLRHSFNGTPEESDIADVIARMAEQDRINEKLRSQQQNQGK